MTGRLFSMDGEAPSVARVRLVPEVPTQEWRIDLEAPRDAWEVADYVDGIEVESEIAFAVLMMAALRMGRLSAITKGLSGRAKSIRRCMEGYARDALSLKGSGDVTFRYEEHPPMLLARMIIPGTPARYELLRPKETP